MNALRKTLYIKFYLYLLLVTVSCERHVEDRNFCYALLYENDSIPSYWIINKVSYDNSYRVDTTYIYENKNKLVDKRIQTFQIRSGRMDKLLGDTLNGYFKPYLTIETSECKEFLYDEQELDEMFSTKFCFLGTEEKLKINGKVFKDVYKFKKVGVYSGIESLAYYDKNFILLKEEYVSGMTYEYSIVRIDSCFIY